MNIDPQRRERLMQVVREQPYPLLFVTISGAHLYGFPSPDSDFDLRGVHVLPVRDVVGLDPGRETIEISRDEPGLELDLVTHDAKKFFAMVIKKNGYVLEQIFSPLILHTTPQHDQLKQIAARCITRHHAHHYLGFAETQWKLFLKESPRRAKPLLYVYRVLLTGIHMMHTGTVEANLLTLNETFKLPYIPDLVRRKLEGPEHSTLTEENLAFHQAEYDRLRRELEDVSAQSALPEAPQARDELNELLINIRIGAPK